MALDTLWVLIFWRQRCVARYSDLRPTRSSVELLQYSEVVIRTHLPFSSTESMFNLVALQYATIGYDKQASHLVSCTPYL
ncbi:uncharacterized protein P174DRAFT_436957, partial [Aspergillus novofumigatus IBT 16806]